ncbi:translesion DNA synthesis-associated protein ImuA [Frateuria sp. MAH-13]|uniref:Translesion DNA synthesis-associated protein ImuA n=1 Tax=Frateuria flava TaxID=2821489 RepID=A0ABS4DJX8_9GAMM|nr:translesion DNA synthesis-associated protein ImuA [Frateuria flava]MBP1473340.1 translesion DNA synthesis-associated protein ImuA [Frateuria flava]
MSNVVALDHLFDARRLWRGQPQARPPSRQPTGFPRLDATLPSGGWPEAALSEVLLPLDGIGELTLLWPTLARLTQADGRVALIAPPYLPFPAAWANAGVRLDRLQVVRAEARDVPWATEQCLRSAACAAVLCWPQHADDRTLRRLQLAAETGQCLGIAMRPASAAAHASPAALRLVMETRPARLRVLKCRGGNPPAQPLPWPLPTGTSEAPPDSPATAVPDRA